LQFPLQLLITDAWNYSTLFWHAIWWDLFLYKSDLNFLFVGASVRRVYNKFLSQFSDQLLISGSWNFSILFDLACHMVVLLYYSDVNFRFVGCITNFRHNFLGNYSSHAWDFSKLFDLSCHMVGFIFVGSQCQLPIYPCVCPYIQHITCNMGLIYSRQS
jgi:hypothetical protein